MFATTQPLNHPTTQPLYSTTQSLNHSTTQPLKPLNHQHPHGSVKHSTTNILPSQAVQVLRGHLQRHGPPRLRQAAEPGRRQGGHPHRASRGKRRAQRTSVKAPSGADGEEGLECCWCLFLCFVVCMMFVGGGRLFWLACSRCVLWVGSFGWAGEWWLGPLSFSWLGGACFDLYDLFCLLGGRVFLLLFLICRHPCFCKVNQACVSFFAQVRWLILNGFGVPLPHG